MKLQRHVMPFKQQLKAVAILAAILTVIELINLLTLRSLTNFTVYPRNPLTLPFIITSPLIHGNVWHFLSNIFPFMILSFFMLQHGNSRYLLTSAISVVTTGLAVWLFARSSAHMGINGLVYTYLGFLLVAGILSRELKLTVISIAVGLFYGGMVFGILPLNAYVSWESNLFGFLSGILCAVFLAKAAPKQVTIEI